MRKMDQWTGEVDKKLTEKNLKHLLEMEFGNVLSYMKLPQEREGPKHTEKDVEVSSLKSRKLTLSYRCLQWPRNKEPSATTTESFSIHILCHTACVRWCYSGPQTLQKALWNSV